MSDVNLKRVVLPQPPHPARPALRRQRQRRSSPFSSDKRCQVADVALWRLPLDAASLDCVSKTNRAWSVWFVATKLSKASGVLAPESWLLGGEVSHEGSKDRADVGSRRVCRALQPGQQGASAAGTANSASHHRQR